MTTLGQIWANQENAQLSTGPKTEEGKARSAQNARTHGLTALVVATKGEDAAGYAVFQESYLKELDPQTVGQMELAERIVGMVWKVRRGETLETALWNSSGGSLEDMAVMLGTHARELELVLRYARQNERQLSCAREEYRRMQADHRRAQEAAERRQAAQAADAQKQKQIKEEDTWALTKAQLEADMAGERAHEAARKAGKSMQEANAEQTQAWQTRYGEEILKARRQLGRPIGKIMADSYYEEEAELEKTDKKT